jgi:hypothetical protein
MKCRICANECPPGAKVCRDCAAARKRAFAATVTQPLLAAAGAPSFGQPRFAPCPAQPRPAPRVAPPPSVRSGGAIATSAADRTAASGGLSLKWLLLGVAIATTIVFVVIKILASGSGHAPDAVNAVDDAAGGAASSIVAREAAPAIASPRDSPQNLPATAADVVPPDAETEVRVAPMNTAPKAGARKAAGKAAGKAEAAKSAPAASPPASKAEPVTSAPRSAPPRVAEAPRDPWQAMNEGLSRCAREGFLDRVACEQRLRAQYCPNHWGLVPQCAIGRTTDHGQ